MKILLIIDAQLEYSQKGNLPVYNYEEIIEGIVKHTKNNTYEKIVLIQHLNNDGIFNKGSSLSNIDSNITKLSNEIVIKHHADSFDGTNLLQLLNEYQNPEIYICGMMTQNCITYTALQSKHLGYKTYVLKDLTSTIDPKVHFIALTAMASKNIILV